MLEGRIDPAWALEAVTPAADHKFTKATTCRRLYVGTGGDLEIEVNGEVTVIPGLPNGSYVDAHVSSVKAANTTASGIVAFF